MDLSRYSNELRELDQRHKSWLSIADKRAIGVLNEMLRHAKALDDQRLLGYVYHSLAFTEHFINGNYDRFIRNLNLSAKALVASADQGEMMHVYYLIALDAVNKGLFDIAHRYFLEARAIAKKQKDETSIAVFDLNIANIFMRIGYYEDAARFNAASFKAIRKDREHIHYYSNLLCAYMNEVLIRMELADHDGAKEFLRKTESIMKRNADHLRAGTRLNYYLIRISSELTQGGRTDVAKEMALLFEELKKTPNPHSYMDDFSRLCRLFIKRRQYDEVRRVIDAITEKPIAADATEALVLLSEIKIDYYTATKNSGELMAAYAEQDQALAMQLQKRQEAYRYVTDLAKFTGKIRKTRSHALDTKEQYTKIARVDELTKIPNRYGATTHLDEAFERAYQTGTRLGVVYADLDDLKFINDTRGHLAGDECLIKLGQVLSEHMEAGDFFAARYGGDEFLMIFENADTKTIRAKITALREECAVNFSFGIHNEIPKEKQKSWQYLEQADKAMYEAKKKK